MHAVRRIIPSGYCMQCMNHQHRHVQYFSFAPVDVSRFQLVQAGFFFVVTLIFHPKIFKQIFRLKLSQKQLNQSHYSHTVLCIHCCIVNQRVQQESTGQQISVTYIEQGHFKISSTNSIKALSQSNQCTAKYTVLMNSSGLGTDW